MPRAAAKNKYVVANRAIFIEDENAGVWNTRKVKPGEVIELDTKSAKYWLAQKALEPHIPDDEPEEEIVSDE